MEQLETLKYKMIEYERNCPERIHHFLKVHSFAKLIGESEGLDTHTQYILETTCMVHDIGIKPALLKYGSDKGSYQEKEGIEPAKVLLSECGYNTEDIERVCFLVGHHHTYHLDAGIDYQILLEADFLVNSYENSMSKEAIIKFRDSIFCTKMGTAILNCMFDLEE